MPDILRQKEELKSFQNLWKGGYFEGDPLDPHAGSSYSAFDERNGFNKTFVATDGRQGAQEIGFVSCLYAAYLVCIRPYVNETSNVLEVGCGHGAWSKAILRHKPNHLFVLDALSAEHNQFWEYVGSDAPASYFQVQDLSCADIGDDTIDFFFSFGVFCHISRAGTQEYFHSIYNKMKSGSIGFVLISDYVKFALSQGVPAQADRETENVRPEPGRWYHLGTDWACRMLADIGFTIVDEDVGVNLRDPVIKFSKR